MVKSLLLGIAKWPTSDLAELLLAIKGILDARAEHHADAKARADRGKGTRKKGN